MSEKHVVNEDLTTAQCETVRADGTIEFCTPECLEDYEVSQAGPVKPCTCGHDRNAPDCTVGADCEGHEADCAVRT